MKLKKYDYDLLTAVESTDKKLLPLFRRAVARRTSELETMLANHAIVRNGAGPAVYHCMARDKYLHGHNHHGAEKVAKRKARPRNFQFYGNPLIVDEQGSGETWVKPSDRATMGGHLVYTFEFDHAGPAFLREQCSWLLPLKDWRASRIGGLFGELKRFADFRLLNVTYSGNKSLHINVVTDTVLLQDRTGIQPSSEALRAGYCAHWLRLQEIVLGNLKPSRGLKPDDSMATFTAFRRMPNGLRKVGGEHPLGLRAGSSVRQVVLWEQAVHRSPASEVFHLPGLFAVTTVATTKARKFSGQAARRAVLTASQHAYCEGWLRQHYEDSGLILDGLHLTGDGYSARFRNSETDGNAGSFMDEGFVVPVLQGHGKDQVGRIEPLPLPLGALLDHLAAEADAAKRFDPNDLEITRGRLHRFMPHWITGNEMSLIHAAEGVGKTTSIMRHIGLTRMTGRLDQPSMFAFSTYEDAGKKANAFNFPDRSAPDAQRSDGYVGVLWRSFSRRYEDAAGRLQSDVLTIDDADEAGTTLWDMVRETQPAVAQVMRKQLESDWAAMAGKKVVLFTVHDVAHRWADNTHTRQMVSPAFFNEDFDSVAERVGSEVNWLIHDEVSPATFLDSFSAREMRWLERLKDNSGKVWLSGSSKRQRAAYSKHCERTGEETAVERQDAQRAMRAGLDTFETIRIRDAEEYGFDTHERTHFACGEQAFFLKRRDWWMEGEKPVANRLVFLTTETVPALVAQRTVEGLTYLRPRSILGRDEVDVCAARSINAENLPDRAKAYAGTSTWVIANRLSGAENTVSPYAVRGRNDLATADIVQFVTMFHPSQYRELQALGTWLGRDDLALLAHVDQINQSCGRNRGARNKGGSHTVYINLTLFRAIMKCPTATDELRYLWRLRMDENQRKNARQGHRGRDDGNDVDQAA